MVLILIEIILKKNRSTSSWLAPIINIGHRSFKWSDRTGPPLISCLGFYVYMVMWNPRRMDFEPRRQSWLLVDRILSPSVDREPNVAVQQEASTTGSIAPAWKLLLTGMICCVGPYEYKITWKEPQTPLASVKDRKFWGNSSTPDWVMEVLVERRSQFGTNWNQRSSFRRNGISR